MSLNFKEIDLVLSELSIVGTRIQKVLQPSYDTIILETFGTEGKKDVLISVSPGACRIHGIGDLPAKNERPLRFMECLRSRVRGGRIESIEQLASDRIIKIAISMPLDTEAEDERQPRAAKGKTSRGIPRAPSQSYALYIRLWSGAGNMLLVDENNLIIDALFRKPEKGESSGLPCRIEESLPKVDAEGNAIKSAKFSVRDLDGEGSFSERVEAHYGGKSGDLSRDTLLAKARERFEKRMRLLESKEAELDRLKKDYSDSERYKQIGDILMAGDFLSPEPAPKECSPKSSAFVSAKDFYTGKRVSIQIDPSLDKVENARKYYEMFRKARSGLNDVSLELDRVMAGKEELRAWLAKLQIEQDPFAIAKALEKAGTVREKTVRKYPCVWIEYKDWTMLVGRSAKENDELLRRHVRGSDLWLHARDYSGSYVFVKARKSKTFPLDIMLDAGSLALYYSKARKNGEGDVYYTQAKYLRRVKDGPKGLVIPTLEKNLFIRIDEARIKEMLDCSLGGDP